MGGMVVSPNCRHTNHAAQASTNTLLTVCAAAVGTGKPIQCHIKDDLDLVSGFFRVRSQDSGWVDTETPMHAMTPPQAHSSVTDIKMFVCLVSRL